MSLTGAITPAQIVYVDNRPAAHPAQMLSGMAASETEADGRQLVDAVAGVMAALEQPDNFAAFREHVLHRLPYAIFALMPVFAAMCALVYRNRRQNYGAGAFDVGGRGGLALSRAGAQTRARGTLVAANRARPAAGERLCGA